jgi:uncharacterized protein YciI
MTEQISADEIRQHPRGGLAKELYLIRSVPSQGLARVKEHLESHLQYLQDLERKGLLFGAGPVFTDNGKNFRGDGLIILNTNSFAEAEKIAAVDPLHQNKARHYTIEAWLLNEGSLNLKLTFNTREIKLQ